MTERRTTEAPVDYRPSAFALIASWLGIKLTDAVALVQHLEANGYQITRREP
jgi:hypothetical protein